MKRQKFDIRSDGSMKQADSKAAGVGRQVLVSTRPYRPGAVLAAVQARAQAAEPKIGSMRPSAKGKRGRA